MADVTSELLKLRDIHLPNPIGHGPSMLGWMILFVLMIGIVLVGFGVWRYYERRYMRTQALLTLQAYQKAYMQCPMDANYAARVSELLKRVALIYFERTSVASLKGAAWVEFLDDTSQKIDFKSIETLLKDAPFKPQTSEDLTPLFIAASAWIKQRRRRCTS